MNREEGAMMPKCVHSCRGLCAALSIAQKKEEEAIREYSEFAAECDYADVRLLLDQLIADRKRALNSLQKLDVLLKDRFAVIDDINDSFA
jgi:rubrerythrin